VTDKVRNEPIGRRDAPQFSGDGRRIFFSLPQRDVGKGRRVRRDVTDRETYEKFASVFRVN